jgi:anti-anti-sigma regulatory factor
MMLLEEVGLCDVHGLDGVPFPSPVLCDPAREAVPSVRFAVISTRSLMQLEGAVITESTAYLVDGITVLKVRGRIERSDLEAWADTLAVAGMLAQGPILIDLDGLEDWSITAQSMLMIAARRAAARGRLLALCRPNRGLHDATTALRVFDRVTTYLDPQDAAAQLGLPSGWTEPPSGGARSATAPVA